MTSITAFPREAALNRPRKDAGRSPTAASEDDRQRGRVNLFAAIAVVLLIAAGWWMVNSFVESQKVQGCYASGTRYCSLI
jgi:ferric-dicitrate binding protein FerR (iron transport regulator)